MTVFYIAFSSFFSFLSFFLLGVSTFLLEVNRFYREFLLSMLLALVSLFLSSLNIPTFESFIYVTINCSLYPFDGSSFFLLTINLEFCISYAACMAFCQRFTIDSISNKDYRQLYNLNNTKRCKRRNQAGISIVYHQGELKFIYKGFCCKNIFTEFTYLSP